MDDDINAFTSPGVGSKVESECVGCLSSISGVEVTGPSTLTGVRSNGDSSGGLCVTSLHSCLVGRPDRVALELFRPFPDFERTSGSCEGEVSACQGDEAICGEWLVII
jgi:hypothetical protein